MKFNEIPPTLNLSGTANPYKLATDNMSSKVSFAGAFSVPSNSQQGNGTVISDRLLESNSSPAITLGTTSLTAFTNAPQDLQYATAYNSALTEGTNLVTLSQPIPTWVNNYAIEEYNQIRQYNEHFGNVTVNNITTNTVVIITQTSDSGSFYLAKVVYKEISTYKYQARELAIHENGLGPIIRYIHRKKSLL
jgi:hypothetical protein